MKNDTHYQQLVDDLRRRHIRGGFGWPGKPIGSRAATRYPNIAAALAASGYWLCTFAEWAGVSPEIMAAVVEDGEVLDGVEWLRLSYRWEGRGPSYLSAPVLQMVDPDTGKGKRRRRELASLLQAAAGLPDPVEDACGLRFYWKRKADGAWSGLKAGNPITYAAYWWACHTLKEALAAERPKPGLKYSRTERRAAV